MRVPLKWLGEYADPGPDPVALADRLDMTGTKVERILRHGAGALELFVVGKVVEAGPHPDADRLSLCRVDVGERETAQIVCAAPNVAAGQTVAVARPGAMMPDGTKLKSAKLRGVVSEGMILAEDELGIGTAHEGILVLDGDADGPPPGTPLSQVLTLADDVLELEVTPNRPDCLGVYGVAREVHAATGAALGPAPWAQDPGSEGSVAGIEITVETELCPRFTARAFENVTPGESPPWLKARLMAAGQRPISNVVDITNYVMLETGQPLHAFDLDRIGGGRLVVREAAAGERVETLDGEQREMQPGEVVICDADGPTSIAGVMGGARSEVSGSTTRVLMEAANWSGPSIQRTSTRLALRSEASGRFEKQLSPEQAMEGLAVATRLMVELTGATPAPGTVDVGGKGPPPATVHLRTARVGALLGAEIATGRCAEILGSLGFGVSEAGDGLDVVVPHWRREDVSREADLIEEVARIDGLENLPATLPKSPPGGGLTPAQRARRRVEDTLAGLGLSEVAGWSFQGPDMARRLRLGDDPAPVAVQNPMSEEQSVMRTLLLGSLLDAAGHNVARGTPDLRLFETGSVYLAGGDDPLPSQPAHVGALLCGAARPASWRSPAPPPADFYAVKGILGALLDALRVPWEVRTASDGPAFLHPGRAARVTLDGEEAGWIGELHPLVAREWDIAAAAAFEIGLDRLTGLAAAVLPTYEDLISFPAVRQDIAVVVSDELAARPDVQERILAAGRPLLRSADVFDVYRGDQVGEGRVSLAFALQFQAPDRTLTDEEVAEVRERIAAAVRDELGGELRA